MAAEMQPSDRPVSRITHLTECPKCGASNPPDTRYCERCGASLAMMAAAAGAETSGEKKQGLFARLRRR